MAKFWIMFDGRAESGDTDDALVLEAVGSSKRAVKAALWQYKDQDAVLVEYDSHPDPLTPDTGILSNERIIGHMREGHRALLQRCAAV